MKIKNTSPLTGFNNPGTMDILKLSTLSVHERYFHGTSEAYGTLRDEESLSEHARIMEELVAEHKYARKTVGKLVEAKERYLKGENTSQEVISLLKELAGFYPMHIKKEDERFFYPCMEYFTKEEQDKMLREFYEFDRNVIHEKYRTIVDRIEVQSM